MPLNTGLRSILGLIESIKSVSLHTILNDGYHGVCLTTCTLHNIILSEKGLYRMTRYKLADLHLHGPTMHRVAQERIR